jgi:hypothetical protein
MRLNDIDAKIDALGRQFDRLASFGRMVDQIGHHVRLDGGITFCTPGAPSPSPAFWERCKRDYHAAIARTREEWPEITLEEPLDLSTGEA